MIFDDDGDILDFARFCSILEIFAQFWTILCFFAQFWSILVFLLKLANICRGKRPRPAGRPASRGHGHGHGHGHMALAMAMAIAMAISMTMVIFLVGTINLGTYQAFVKFLIGCPSPINVLVPETNILPNCYGSSRKSP